MPKVVQNQTFFKLDVLNLFMKKRYGVLLTLIVIILMIFVLKDINFIEVLNLLKEIILFWFWFAFLSIALMFVLWTLRFKNTLRGLTKQGTGFFYFLAVFMSGVFVNTITPGSNVGGEPIRAYFLSRKFKKQKTKFLGSIIADKFFNIAVFSLFLLFSILFVLLFVKISFILKIIFEGFLLLIIFIGILVIFLSGRKIKFNLSGLVKKVYRFKRIRKKFKSFKKFESYIFRRIRNLGRVFKEGIFNKRTLFIGISLSFLIWILNFLSSYFLFLAFDASVSFLSVIIVITLSYAVGDLSPIPGGIGLVESSMFLFYSAMGVPGSLAITVSLLSRVIYYFYAIIVGGLSLLYLRIKLK